MQLISVLSLLKQSSIQQYTSVVYKTRTALDPSQNLFFAMYVIMPYSLGPVSDLISCNHVFYWIPICLNTDSWDTDICILQPLPAHSHHRICKWNEYLCALRWFYYHSQNRQCISWTATEQPSLHDERTQNPCQVVEISNYLVTFFIESKPMNIYLKLSRHFVGYSVLVQVFKKIL